MCVTKNIPPPKLCIRVHRLRAKVVGSDSCITTDMVTMDSNTTGNGTSIPTLVKCTTPTMLVRRNLELMVFIFHGAVWFSFFLTSFSENLAVGRIWLWGESEYHYDYVWRKIKLFIGLRI